jgi:hypothetical protein
VLPVIDELPLFPAKVLVGCMMMTRLFFLDEKLVLADDTPRTVLSQPH